MHNDIPLKIKFYFISLLVFVYCSCATRPKFAGTADCCGRICGENGAGISGYTLSIGGLKTVITGPNGSFVFPETSCGTYTLAGYGRGWSSVNQKIEFRDKRMVTCVQIESTANVYKRCEKMISEKNTKLASALLDSIEKGNSSETMYKFYRKLISYCESPSKRKQKSLFSFVNGIAEMSELKEEAQNEN